MKATDMTEHDIDSFNSSHSISKFMADRIADEICILSKCNMIEDPKKKQFHES